MRTFLSSILLFVFMTACPTESGNNSQKDPEPTNTEKLARAWRVGAVTSNNISSATNFRIIFTSNNTYTITNPANIPAPNKTAKTSLARTSGSWAFADSDKLVIFDKTDTVAVEALSQIAVTLRWTDNSKKTTPTYAINYVPAN